MGNRIRRHIACALEAPIALANFFSQTDTSESQVGLEITFGLIGSSALARRGRQLLSCQALSLGGETFSIVSRPFGCAKFGDLDVDPTDRRGNVALHVPLLLFDDLELNGLTVDDIVLLVELLDEYVRTSLAGGDDA